MAEKVLQLPLFHQISDLDIHVNLVDRGYNKRLACIIKKCRNYEQDPSILLDKKTIFANKFRLRLTIALN